MAMEKGLCLLCDFGRVIFINLRVKVMQHPRVFGIIRFILELPEIKCNFAKEIDLIIVKHSHRFCGHERKIDPYVNKFCNPEMPAITKSFLNNHVY